VKIDYFVSYHAVSHRGQNNIGRSSISTDKPISNIDEVKQVEKTIADANGFKTVLVMNFQRFDTERGATR
jgi:hypothetical protein